MKPWYCTDCDAYPGEGARAVHSMGAGGHTVSETDIFGPGSELIRNNETVTGLFGPPSWSDSATYEILTVSVFLFFCSLLYTYRKNLKPLMKTLLRQTPLDKVYEEQTLAFKHFLRLSQLFAVLLATGIFIRATAFFGLPAKAHFPPFLRADLAVPAVLLTLGGIALYRILAIRLIAGVTQNTSFFSRYRFMTRIFSTSVSLVLAPFFLSGALYDGPAAQLLVYPLLFLCGTALPVYLKSSAQFFIERKVSVLQWILYLCTVELLPFSFLWFLWMRNTA